MPLLSIPELGNSTAGQSLIRIPYEIDVPLTERVRRLIDLGPVRRLARISQLGLVSLVYPGATHSRFEHSLGVYRNAILFLRQLARGSDLESIVTSREATTFMVASLLHDVGHWPYCHPIEDIRLAGIQEHEELATNFILNDPLASCIQDDWDVAPQDVVDMLMERHQTPSGRLLQSMLSGPIDIDKLDYLYRDSLHAGVPYGRHFDRSRLIASLCLNETGDGLAINAKGKTAAELMVFARYVMFSEVYWHHAVRSATAMLQRAFYRLRALLDGDAFFALDENGFQQTLLRHRQELETPCLVEGLFGENRILHKQVVEYSFFDNEERYSGIARRPYDWLVDFSSRLAEIVESEIGGPVAADEILIDAPPVGLEVEFAVDVFDARSKTYRALGEISPVVQTLAQRQFDDFVKRVRIFVHPRLRDSLRAISSFDRLVDQAIASM